MIPPDEDGGLKEQIRLHATRLFAQRGFAGTSMRDLVEACKCTKAACYYYFASKEALYRDVVEEHAMRIHEIMEATMRAQGSIRERLHAGLDAMVSFAIENPVAMQLMQRVDLSSEDTAPSFEEAPSRETHLCQITELIEEGGRTGELRGDMQAAEGALIITGALQIQFDAGIASGTWDRKQMHRTIDLAFDGIAKT